MTQIYKIICFSWKAGQQRSVLENHGTFVKVEMDSMDSRLLPELFSQVDKLLMKSWCEHLVAPFPL